MPQNHLVSNCIERFSSSRYTNHSIANECLSKTKHKIAGFFACFVLIYNFYHDVEYNVVVGLGIYWIYPNIWLYIHPSVRPSLELTSEYVYHNINLENNINKILKENKKLIHLHRFVLVVVFCIEYLKEKRIKS